MAIDRPAPPFARASRSARLARLVLLAAAPAAHAAPVDEGEARGLAILGSAFPLAAIGLGTLVAVEGAHAPIRDVGAAIAIGGSIAGVVTPAIGDFYAHRYLAPGIALRAGGLITTYIGLILTFNTEVGDCAASGPCHHSASSIGVLAAGAGLYLGGVVLDIVGAPAAARAWNAEHELQVAPTAIVTPSSKTTGLAVALRF